MISESKITVRYAETDKMGIVYHTNYGIWYEIGRTNFLKDLGFNYTKMEELGIMLPVTELNCKYIIPALYDDTIIIKTSIKKLTPVKIEFSYELFKEGESTLINRGYSIHAFVDNDMKIINLKKTKPSIFELISKGIQKTVDE